MLKLPIIISSFLFALGVALAFVPLPLGRPPLGRILLPARITLPDRFAVCEVVVLSYLAEVREQLGPRHFEQNPVRYYFDAGETPANDHVVFPESFFHKYRNHTPQFRKAIELAGWKPFDFWSPNWYWSFRAQQIDQDTYKVSGGYYCGGLCAKHCEYRVVRKDEKWTIASTNTCIVS